MSEIDLKWALPEGAVVKGVLLRRYDDEEDLALLDQDVIEVELPDGMLVSVGWFPEHDRKGEFRIRVTQNFERLQEITAAKPLEVAKKVIEIVNAQYYGPQAPAQQVDDTDQTEMVTTLESPQREARAIPVYA